MKTCDFILVAVSLFAFKKAADCCCQNERPNPCYNQWGNPQISPCTKPTPPCYPCSLPQEKEEKHCYYEFYKRN